MTNLSNVFFATHEVRGTFAFSSEEAACEAVCRNLGLPFTEGQATTAFDEATERSYKHTHHGLAWMVERAGDAGLDDEQIAAAMRWLDKGENDIATI